MTNPDPAAPLTEAEERLRADIVAYRYHAYRASDVEYLLTLREHERQSNAGNHLFDSACYFCLLDFWMQYEEDAARATSTPAGLDELVRRLIAEYDEDNRRSPSFVTIGLLREAVGED
jgi:hypothetical protein